MKLLTTLISGLLIFGLQTVNASTLAPGAKSLRVEVATSKASKHWYGKGGTEKVDIGNGTDTADFKGLYEKLSLSLGVTEKFQMDFSFSYFESEFSPSLNGTMGPDKLSQAQYLGAQGTWDLYSNSDYEVHGFVGVRAPVYGNKEPNVYLTSVDGYTNIDLGFTNAFFINSWLSVWDEVKYIARPGAPGDQVSVTLGVPFSFAESWQAGPMATYFNTLDGDDIGPGGDSMTFYKKQEAYTGYGVTVAKTINEKWSADAFYFTKASGRNTDQSTSYGLAFDVSL